MKDNLLEVGDELYRYVGMSNTTMTIAGTVDRVTKTLAFVGNLKLRRSLGMGFTHAPGATGYSYATYRLVTDDVREKISEQDKRRKLTSPLIAMIDGGRASVNRLTNDQLERINSILAEPRA